MNSASAIAKKSQRQSGGQDRKNPPKPRTITAEYLEKAALFYLQRYAASTHSLRQVLLRRLRKSGVHRDEKFLGMVETTIAAIAARKLLNDRDFAWHKIRSMHSGGKSLRQIRAKLKQKGIHDQDAQSALDQILADDPDLEYQSAMSFARRKKLGPFAGAREKEYKKQLQQFAMAGFSLAMAKKIIHMKNEDDHDIDSN